METDFRKPHRNQDEMFLLVTTWKNSGLSQQEFCKKKSIPYNTFQYWYRKYNLIHKSSSESDFAEMRPVIKSFPAEIIFPSGARLVLSSVDPSFIKSLLL